jgi:guanylate kinase
MEKSNIFMISGPSGAGEDSILEKLKDSILFEKIITSTTREMRPGESQGDPYYFISKKEFETKIGRNEFYEYAEEDRGNFYGVTKKEIERVLNISKPIIWKLDYKGVLAVKKLFPSAVAILIDVPVDVIENRIRRRDNLSEEYIQGRLQYARGWYENRGIFDFFVKNEEGKMDEAVEKIAEIIKKHNGATD